MAKEQESSAIAETEIDTEEVVLERIIIWKNHRSAADDPEVEALASSIRKNGLQQPIGVADVAGTDRFVLVWGARRLAACRLLGMRMIPARVYPEMSESEMAVLRAAENMDRLGISAVESAVAVEHAVSAKIAEVGDEDAGEVDVSGISMAAIAWAADRFGRSAAWVRDHLFLMRLSGRAREITESGALPVRYAREIAKLTDAAVQERLVLQCFDGGWSDHPDFERLTTTFDQLKRWVSQEMNSLRGVPWVLEEKFANRRACSACPDNTDVANQTALFSVPGADGADDGESKPRCMNPACYKAKTNEAAKVIPAALTRDRAKLAKLEAVTPVQLTRAGLVPRGVRASVFAGRAKKALAGTSAKTQKAAQAPSAEKAVRHPGVLAVEAWAKYHKPLEERLLLEICRRGADDPGLVLRLIAMDHAAELALGERFYVWDPRSSNQIIDKIRADEKNHALHPDRMPLLVNDGSHGGFLEVVERHCSLFVKAAANPRKRPKERSWFADGIGLAAPLFSACETSAILSALGVQFGYRPIDEFLDRERDKVAKAETPAAKKKAVRKKPAAKKKNIVRRKATKKKAAARKKPAAKKKAPARKKASKKKAARKAK